MAVGILVLLFILLFWQRLSIDNSQKQFDLYTFDIFQGLLLGDIVAQGEEITTALLAMLKTQKVNLCCRTIFGIKTTL